MAVLMDHILPEAALFELQQSAAARVLLDIRPLAEFVAGHLRGAAHLSWPELTQQQHLLPAPDCELRLLLNPDQDSALAWLSARGYQPQAYYWTAALAAVIQAAGDMQQGASLVHLWRANPLLMEVIDQIEHVNTSRCALDLACGAGRDSMFLALRGWSMTSVDYLPEHLAKLQQFAAEHQLPLITQHYDLQQGTAGLMGEQDLVLVFRYLNRALLPELADLVKADGFLLYQTFEQGCEVFGSPRNPNYLLKPNELAQHFADWQILINRTDNLADGRPMQSFLARKAKKPSG